MQPYELKWAVKDAIESQDGVLRINQERNIDFRQQIDGLERLRTIELSSCDLKSLPRGIRRLVALESLCLPDNEITSIGGEITCLPLLETVDLSGNSLRRFPQHVGKISRLRTLNLSRNQLSEIPDVISECSNLVDLDMSKCNILSVSSKIGALAHLKSLNLASNQIETLPSSLTHLHRLHELRLEHNDIREIPPEFGSLDLRVFDLSQNPLRSPPRSIVDQGTKAILTFLREQTEDSERQWLSKLLVVGEGGAGKTCMLRSLRSEPFDPQMETTHGMQITTLAVTHPKLKKIKMTLNCWDFGGQEIYHATHQFFLSNRSLFVLVWNARQGYEQGKLYYWLETITALAPDSPVIVVATHTDERDPVLPIEDLKRNFPQIANHAAISNRTGDGVKQLLACIKKTASDLPLMGEPWPASWLSAVQKIKQRGDVHTSRSQLDADLVSAGVKKQDCRILSRWMHELGDILFFEDDAELKEIALLDAEWVNQRISRVLESGDVIGTLGVLRRNHMNELWSDVPIELREPLLRLMERFDLSYRIPDDPENKSLIVERLSLDPPANYLKHWNAAMRKPGCKEIQMKFDLRMTRPAGIPTWFIARSHRFSTNTHWRYGAIFADSGKRHVALLQTPPSERVVTLAVRGPSPYGFFELLRDGFELTLARFKGLRSRRLVRCSTQHKGQRCSHEFDYHHLLQRIEREEPKYQIECPVCEETISISGLLFGIHWSTQGAVLEMIQELQRGSVARHEDTLRELDDLRQLSQREFTNLFKRDQRLPESHCPRVFTIRPFGRNDSSTWSKIRGAKCELQLYCEAPGQWHPVGQDGKYLMTRPAEYLNALAPYVRRLVTVFKCVAPLVGPWLGMTAAEYEMHLKNEIKMFEQLVTMLPDVKTSSDPLESNMIDAKNLRPVRKLLEDLDPQHLWGGLSKVLTPEGHYLWLCPYHAKEFLR